jgi:type VI secretion system protein ImpF
MDREAIRRAIERSVRIFEPRLSRVQVSLVEGGDFNLSFRITGLLRMDPGVESVVYDADLPKESRRFRVLPGR